MTHNDSAFAPYFTQLNPQERLALCARNFQWNLARLSEPGAFTPGDDALSEADITSGLYDGAEVELWRVDWTTPSLKVRLWRGRIARLRRDGERFTAELEGPAAVLERVVGRTYGRLCDAVLGDGRCGVNRSEFPGQTCDKSWATCRGVFGNGDNFQGFPDIPGDDYLIAFPAEGGRHDGGSRRA